MWARGPAVLAAFALLIGACSPAVTSAGTEATNRQAARRDARGLLGRLNLPSGAVPSASEPTGEGAALLGPAEGPPATPVVVDLHRWWRVPGSPAAVLSFIRSHPPRGGKQSVTGSSNQARILGFSWPPVRGVLGQRELVVVVARLADGSTGVRADAEVVWIVARPPGERVPSGAHVLVVKRGSFPPDVRPVSLAVTDLAKIQTIAAMLNRLQIVQPGFIACPLFIAAPTVSLTFLAAPSGRPVARASMRADGPNGPCSPISFSVRGHQRKPLLAFPAFLRRVGRVLGVGLTS